MGIARRATVSTVPKSTESASKRAFGAPRPASVAQARWAAAPVGRGVARPRDRLGPVQALWCAAIEALWQGVERRRERRQLAGLDGAALKDFGCSSADSWAEAAKPFWRD